MIAYHGDQAVKAKYVQRLQGHRAAERLIQGQGWDGFKGCAVGCTMEEYTHAAYETELGIPEQLARLEDSIFEELPKAKAEQFAVDFLQAVPVGADLSGVCSILAITRHTQALERLAGNTEPYAEQVRAALRGVITYLQAPTESAAESACSAAESAWSAAESAWSAAESAAESAAGSAAGSAAESAAESAWSAAGSARSAAWSARSAAGSAAESAWSAAESAWSAAGSAHWEWEAETLLSLLRSSK